MKTVEQAILDKILYIGDKIPEAVANDPRPKFVVLGYPQELIDETTPISENKPKDTKDNNAPKKDNQEAL